jgi:hypothetical protein
MRVRETDLRGILMLQFRAQRPVKPEREPKAVTSSALLQPLTPEPEGILHSVESPMGLPPAELPARFRASWMVQSVQALFGGLRRAWRWMELGLQRPQQDKPNSDVRQCCPTAGEGSDGQPKLSSHRQVEDGSPFSIPSKTALDYLVKKQQLAESGADSNKIKTEEPHTQQGLKGQDLASRADSIAVQFESQISIEPDQY